MTLREAMKNRGDDDTTIETIIEEMVEQVNFGEDPEDVLHEEGLEPDYVIDLLHECQ